MLNIVKTFNTSITDSNINTIFMLLPDGKWMLWRKMSPVAVTLGEGAEWNLSGCMAC